MDSLFEPEDAQPAPACPPDAPLAARMRPRDLRSSSARSTCSATGSALRTAIEQGRPHSMILHGPPGTREDDARADRRRERRRGVRGAERRAGRQSRGARGARDARRSAAAAAARTIFFLDEIHRFNKAQQDALLPAVEEGLVTLIGATTENPSFEVNGALLSRVRVYELEELTEDDVAHAAAARAGARRVRRRARSTTTRSQLLAARAGGDARTALAALELACRTAPEGRRHAGARGGRAAAADPPLRPRRRPPLRHDLRLDQGDARVRPRRRRSTTSR